jgi:type I restriction enzyme S subunit
MREDWKKTKLGDICFIRRGSSPRPIKNYLIQEGGMPWVKISDATEANGKYINSTAEQIKMEGVSKSVIVNPGDLILSNSGTAGLPMFMGITACIHDGWQTFRDLNGIDKEYLYYFLLFIRHILLHNAYDSVMKNLTLDMLRDYEMYLPPMEEQKRVVDVLQTIDNKIETNNKINRNLEEQAFALFDSYFPNVMYGENRIGDYISPSRGKNLVTKDAIPGDVPVVAGGLSPSTYHNEANTIGPVLTISASGANAGYVALWNQSVWSSDSSYIDSSMTDDVYFWYIMLKKRQKEIFDSQTGSAQPHIYPKHIDVMSVIELDKDNIEIYTREVTPMFIMIGNNNEENLNLSVVRDSLLPKLMSGELDVCDLDI